MSRKKHVHPYENDVLPAEAIAAARIIIDCKTEDDYGAAFNLASDALMAAWDNDDGPGQEHWRLVFSAYVRLRPRRIQWETEYHNGLTAADYAYGGDPRFRPDNETLLGVEPASSTDPSPVGPGGEIDDDIPF